MYLKNSDAIYALSAEAYRYMRRRSEFWRQQEPMYMHMTKTSTAQHKITAVSRTSDDLNALERMVHMLQDISKGNFRNVARL